MGQRHSDLMQLYFPNQKTTGIDLGNIEIKECKNAVHKYTISKKDLDAEFLLFYDWLDDEYLFVNSTDMPQIKRKKREINIECKRAISTAQVRTIAYFTTKDQNEFMNEMEAIIKDKSHLGWLLQQTTNPDSILSTEGATSHIVVGDSQTQVK